jgi:hypothetical protein
MSQRSDHAHGPLPRKHAESPHEFYERVTQREDVRRLLEKLADAGERSEPSETLPEK